MILGDRVGRAPLGEIARDQRPASAAIVGLQDVGLVVAALVIVDDGVGDVGVVHRGDDVLDERHVGHTAERVRAAPVLAAVLGDAHDAVIGADVDQSFLEWTLREPDRGPVHRGRIVLRDRVHAPDPAHDLELVAIQLPGQVRADDAPGVAAVVGLKELLGRVEDTVDCRAG